MTDPNYSVLVAVVDRSGSMGSIREDAQGGLNTLLEEQKAQPGRLDVTLVQFDDQVETVADLVDVKDVPPYVLTPRGTTALYDAVGQTMARVGQRLAAMPEDERPGKVMFLVVTDGRNNASHEYNLEMVRGAIQLQRETYGWEFMFLGAGESTWGGHAMGIAQTHGYDPTMDGVTRMYAAASASVTRTRSGGSFTFVQQDQDPNGGAA